MIEDLYTKPLALVVIGALAVTLVFIYRELVKERNRNDFLQDARVKDAQDYRDKITEPMTKLSQQQEILTKQYDVLINQTNKRGA
jgi:hypothetical protein